MKILLLSLLSAFFLSSCCQGPYLIDRDHLYEIEVQRHQVQKQLGLREAQAECEAGWKLIGSDESIEHVKGLYLIQKAADHGHVYSQFVMGMIHLIYSQGEETDQLRVFLTDLLKSENRDAGLISLWAVNMVKLMVSTLRQEEIHKKLDVFLDVDHLKEFKEVQREINQKLDKLLTSENLSK